MDEDAKLRVCQDIIRIMKVYDEQEARGYVDSPGGLSNMGDVWQKLLDWRDMLVATKPA